MDDQPVKKKFFKLRATNTCKVYQHTNQAAILFLRRSVGMLALSSEILWLVWKSNVNQV